MYLVDTSVWVDYLRGEPTPEALVLNELLAGEEVVGVAPIILQEILQGADTIERFEKNGANISRTFFVTYRKNPSNRTSRPQGSTRHAGQRGRRLGAAMTV
ncbi:MAG: PIN domain-containing protein [Burkholderiales bacterium]